MEKNIYKEKIISFALPMIVILIVVSILQMLYLRRATDLQELKPQNGVIDVSGIDFTDSVYTIANSWDFYPNKIYSSADFKEGVEEPSNIIPGKTPFGTYRLIFKGKPKEYYSICGYSVDYASEIFVNGVKVYSFGKVGNKPENSIPKTGYQTVPIFTDEKGEAELICTFSNFVHNDGGTIHETIVSTPQNIEEYKVNNSVFSIVLGGALFILSLYFLLYASIQKEKNYLLLALCCIAFSFRDQLFTFLNLFPQNISWELGYRIYISVINLLPVVIIALLGGLFPYGNKKLKYGYFGIVAVFLLVICFADTKSLPLINLISYLFAIPYALYLIVKIIKHFFTTKKIFMDNKIALVGFSVLIASLVVEGVFSLKIASVLRYGLTPTAMLVFVFLIAISISLSVQKQKAELAESKSREQMLEKMNTMNLEFLQKIAHELKTPLAVISGYAQLTKLQISSNNINDETIDNLGTIQNEATRLADMVTKLSEYSYGKKSTTEFSEFSVSSIFSNAQAICGPMCLKNNNKVVCKETDLKIFGNSEIILQILINLIVNANKHTKNGTITLSSKLDFSRVVITVSDTGEGIPKDKIPYIFDKGYSADGGTGLGLAICVEALETHKGHIWLAETSSSGTAFTFDIPCKEGENEQNIVG